MKQTHKPMAPANLSMVLASFILGVLDCAVNWRVDHLGGWHKAVKKQGVIDQRDKGVKQLQQVEENLFNAMHQAVKQIEKTLPSLIDQKNPPQAYELAAIMTDEFERIMNEFNSGHTGAITYSDGYRQALADMHQLMFDQKKTRTAALELLAQKHPLPQDLRQAV